LIRLETLRTGLAPEKFTISDAEKTRQKLSIGPQSGRIEARNNFRVQWNSPLLSLRSSV